MKTPEQKIKLIQTIEQEISNEKNREMGAGLLEPFLNEVDLAVRLEAVRVLYNFDKARSLKILKSLSAEKNPDVRMKTVIAAGEIATAESLSILLNMVYDEDMSVRKAVLKKLNGVKNKGTIQSKVFNDKLKYLLDEIRKRERWIID